MLIDGYLLLGVLNAVDGEKDPRCLVQCFRLVSQLYASFPSTVMLEPIEEPFHGENYDEMEVNENETVNSITLGEKVFNIIARYFPITFNPPPNDRHGITSTMLIQSLKHALCDDMHVSSFAVPFLMDQMLAPPESVCRSHSIFYLHYLVRRYSRRRERDMDTLLPHLPHVLSQLSEALYDIALEDTSAVQTFSIDRQGGELEMDDAPSHVTLSEQAINFMGDICKQIGTSNHGELYWSQFGESIISEIAKSARKSVQSLTIKTNMKIALKMASSTYKITATISDRIVPVLLEHVRPVLVVDIDKKSNMIEPEKLLQHDLERKRHSKNSAAAALLFIADFISSTMSFGVSLSQYSKTSDAFEGDASPWNGLFDLLHSYAMHNFNFSAYNTIATNDYVSTVALYVGCLKTLQSLVSCRVSGGVGPDEEEMDLLKLACLNCIVDTSAGGAKCSSWEDVRQASVLYVACCRNLYLIKESNDKTDLSPRFALFKEGCVDVLQSELRSVTSQEKLNFIFHTISFLLRPFSALTSNDCSIVKDKTAPWCELDNKLLSILLGCITNLSGETSSADMQTIALEALLRCLPDNVSDSAVLNQNFIVDSLVADDESGGQGDSSMQKLIDFAIGSRFVLPLKIFVIPYDENLIAVLAGVLKSR